MNAHNHKLGAAAGFSPVPAVAPTYCPAAVAEVSPASVAAVSHSNSNRSAEDAAIISPGQTKVVGRGLGNQNETATHSRCPDCDGPFSYRIVDEDTRCSYPVDDGEHYCLNCDALFTDEFLNGDEPEDVRVQFAKIFGTPEGWSRIEL